MARSNEARPGQHPWSEVLTTLIVAALAGVLVGVAMRTMGGRLALEICELGCSPRALPAAQMGPLVLGVVLGIRTFGWLVGAALGARPVRDLAYGATAPMMVALVLVGLTIMAGMRAAEASSACRDLCDTGLWHVVVGVPLLDVYAFGGLALVWLPVAITLTAMRRSRAPQRTRTRVRAPEAVSPAAPSSWSDEIRRHPSQQ